MQGDGVRDRGTAGGPAAPPGPCNGAEPDKESANQWGWIAPTAHGTAFNRAETPREPHSSFKGASNADPMLPSATDGPRGALCDAGKQPTVGGGGNRVGFKVPPNPTTLRSRDEQHRKQPMCAPSDGTRSRAELLPPSHSRPPPRDPPQPPPPASTHGGGLVGRPSNLSLSCRSALVSVERVMPSSLRFSSGCFWM